jgi:hypothetical protein
MQLPSDYDFVEDTARRLGIAMQYLHEQARACEPLGLRDRYGL